jgi:hypothetical protein
VALLLTKCPWHQNEYYGRAVDHVRDLRLYAERFPRTKPLRLEY